MFFCVRARNFCRFSFWANSTHEKSHLVLNSGAFGFADYKPLIRPTAGLLDFLEALRREGIACAVGSSAEMRNIRFVFEKCGIESYFQTVVSSEQVTRCKPDPEIYLKAAEALRLRPEECVVFEDARAGIEAGDRAGMKVVALATTLSREELERTAATLVIDDFTQMSVERLRSL